MPVGIVRLPILFIIDTGIIDLIEEVRKAKGTMLTFIVNTIVRGIWDGMAGQFRVGKAKHFNRLMLANLARGVWHARALLLSLFVLGAWGRAVTGRTLAVHNLIDRLHCHTHTAEGAVAYKHMH